MNAIEEMESCNRYHHQEYLVCERCGSDNTLEWLPSAFPEDWDWQCACGRCGHQAYFSKAAGKMVED